MKKTIYNYNGKQYIRIGECTRCGECCLSFATPCKYLHKNEDATYTCLIHDKLKDTPPFDDVHPSGCLRFPEPSDLMTPLKWNLHKLYENRCGFRFLEVKKVLVACPNHESKEYSMQAWVDSVNKLSYPNYDVLMVDNSPTLDFMNRWKNKVPMVHLNLQEGPNRRIAESMEYIRQYALEKGYDYWFSLESDIIPQNDVIEIFLKHGHYDWYESHYPYRDQDWAPILNGFGCTMFSRRLLEENSFVGAPETSTTDGWFWNQVVTKNKNYADYKVLELYNEINIRHLGKEDTT